MVVGTRDDRDGLAASGGSVAAIPGTDDCCVPASSLWTRIEEDSPIRIVEEARTGQEQRRSSDAQAKDGWVLVATDLPRLLVP